MSVKKYLETTAIFTIDEFKNLFPTVTDYNLLSRAVTVGKVLRVTNGLYVSNTGRYTEVQHDKFLIVSKLVPDTVFAYHSALELLGVAHSLSNRVQYFSSVKRKDIEFQGNVYKRYRASQSLNQIVRATAFGEVKVTTKEQTLMDCLSNIGKSGGAEEVLRSLSAFPYIDIKIVKEHIDTLSKSTVARIGWFLENMQLIWNISDNDLDYLNRILKAKSYHFISDSNTNNGWSKRWKLVLPAHEEEMKGWLT